MPLVSGVSSISPSSSEDVSDPSDELNSWFTGKAGWADSEYEVDPQGGSADSTLWLPPATSSCEKGLECPPSNWGYADG